MANNVGVKIDYNKIIRPDLASVVKKDKIIGYAGALACVFAVVVFVLIVTLVVKNFGGWYLFLLIAPLALFLLGAVIAVRYSTYSAIAKAYLETVNEIKGQDVAVIAEYMGEHPDTVSVARKLIETGNLDGYEMVADLVLAKLEKSVSVDEAKNLYAEYKKKTA